MTVPANLTPEARRDFLRLTFWTAGAMAASATGMVSAAPSMPMPGRTRLQDIGPLGAPDANGIRLPAGFSSRVVAQFGKKPAKSSSYAWHAFPDGGATFAMADGGWIYVSNSEVPLVGGVGMLRFDAQCEVIDARRLLAATTSNCAGGKTPWQTWLSGEEFDLGRVWEVYPQGRMTDARPRPALGIFKHEAVAVDPASKILYLTEDDPSGRFYRFVCSSEDWPQDAARPRLERGRLQVMKLVNVPVNQYPGADLDLGSPQRVEWQDVEQPGVAQGLVRSILKDKAPGTVFKGGEGLWYVEGLVYFSTKGDNRIWAYDHSAQTVEVIYDFARVAAPNNVLSGVDNLTVSQWGDVLVAEDGGNMELCLIHPDRSVQVLLQVVGQDGSELTGPAFSPDGSRLYFSSQRGGASKLGITYEVTLTNHLR
ncbi:alkaline phosphatase PhoX [Aquabacterium sp.]|uniref:alkaline phosphatase PhoX n=1 Tax=Aquabacterium sp. TaxID=1872578 RepID=UPI0025C55799|nr:alkaline phosphatase PhoX [Aquabacterium sp.]